MKMAVTNPNFSVIMPVGCQAKCDFCYWEAETDLNIVRFKEAIGNLGIDFEQCSITGGEPTMADDLPQYIKAATRRFDKVVLNTNGYKLNDSIIQSVDYVNISVHHYDEYSNRKIFGTADVPNNVELKEFCKHGNVTFNCVLSDDFADFQFIKDYIRFAKYCGAKVAFRKYYSDLNILDAVDLEDTLIGDHSCGACLHRYHIINDVEVTFKYSVPETNEVMGSPYEAILHANGKLTYDWAGEKELTFNEEIPDECHSGIAEAIKSMFNELDTPDDVVKEIAKRGSENNDSTPSDLEPFTEATIPLYPNITDELGLAKTLDEAGLSDYVEAISNSRTVITKPITFEKLRELSIDELENLCKQLDDDESAQGCHGPRHKAYLTLYSKKKAAIEEAEAEKKRKTDLFNAREAARIRDQRPMPRGCGGGCG